MELKKLGIKEVDSSERKNYKTHCISIKGEVTTDKKTEKTKSY